MHDAVAAMLKQYGPIRSPRDEDNALAEILHQITLLGLYRGGFFKKASFYGGTALRLLYGLDRFSEDMDFCLADPDPHFRFEPYLPAVADELDRFGFSARLEEKRSGPDVTIGSAFVKHGTYSGLLVIGRRRRRITKGQPIKVRLEVDKADPPGGVRTQRLIKLPIPFMVGTLSEASLFAGKLHALLARAYANRVKGRDYYDFLFYVARNTHVNRSYLEAKLRDSGHFASPNPLELDHLKQLLTDKFEVVDFERAKADVLPFVTAERARDLDTWSPELFSAMAQGLCFTGSSR